MVKDLLNQVWVCVKRYIILTLSQFKTKLNKNHLAKISIHMDGRCCSTLKFEKWNVICYNTFVNFLSWNQRWTVKMLPSQELNINQGEHDCFEAGTILNEQLKNYFQKLCCMFTFAFESATFSWLLLFITKYRASSKKSSTSTLFFCLDEALATLLLMWRLSVDELSLSSLDWAPSIGDVAFLFLLFTLDFFSCSLSSASLRFSIKRKSQLL